MLGRRVRIPKLIFGDRVAVRIAYREQVRRRQRLVGTLREIRGRHHGRPVERNVERGAGGPTIAVARHVGEHVLQVAAGRRAADRRYDVGDIAVTAVGVEGQVAIGAGERLPHRSGSVRGIADANNRQRIAVRIGVVREHAAGGADRQRRADDIGAGVVVGDGRAINSDLRRGAEGVRDPSFAVQVTVRIGWRRSMNRSRCPCR